MNWYRICFYGRITALRTSSFSHFNLLLNILFPLYVMTCSVLFVPIFLFLILFMISLTPISEIIYLHFDFFYIFVIFFFHIGGLYNLICSICIWFFSYLYKICIWWFSGILVILYIFHFYLCYLLTPILCDIYILRFNFILL